MSDGAHLGVTAGRAIDTILGGDPPPEKDEGMTPEQMRAFIESDTPAEDSYSEGSRLTAKAMLAFLDKYPQYKHLEADNAHTWGKKPDGSVDYEDYRITGLGLYDAAELAGFDMPDGLTGFMVGWAVNAAKYAAGAPPVANPALLTIG